MGGTLYGNWFRQVILTSIALSQIGFVCGESRLGIKLVDPELTVLRRVSSRSLYHFRCREPASIRPRSHQVQKVYPDQVPHRCPARSRLAPQLVPKLGRTVVDRVDR